MKTTRLLKILLSRKKLSGGWFLILTNHNAMPHSDLPEFLQALGYKDSEIEIFESTATYQ
jgi:hypothetical protein